MALKILKPGKRKKKGGDEDSSPNDADDVIAQRVHKIYQDQDKKNNQRFQAKLESARAYDAGTQKLGTSWGYMGNTGVPEQTRQWRAGNKGGGVSAAKTVITDKDSGAYNSGPQLSGGTKKMIRISRRNVRQNSASPQAKKSARRLY